MKEIYLLIAVLLSGLTFSQPVITSFSPSSGLVGTAITLTGSNFNTIPGNNIIFFGATRAYVSSGSASSLTVDVPAGATYSFISVTDSLTGLTGFSASQFVTTFPCGTGITASSFLPKVDYVGGNKPATSTTGDYDGDGKPDIAVTNNIGNTVSVFRNISTPGLITFSPRIDYVTGTTPRCISSVDIDGDGKLDLIVANLGSNSFSVFKNTSTSGAISFAPKIDFTTGTQPLGIAFNDVNGDGKPDVVVTNFGANTLSVFPNTSTTSSISFGIRVDFATASQPVSIAIEDLNADQKPDLVVVNYSAASVSTYRNTSVAGSVSFATKVDFATGANPYSVVIGDLDMNGLPDLAVAGSYNGTGGNCATTFRNTSSAGVISFAAKVDFAVGTTPYSIAIADLTGDGKPDLALTNSVSNTVSFLRNTSVGSIAFAAKVDKTTGTNPFSVSLADFNSDGRPDAIVANNNANTVSVFRNQEGAPAMTSAAVVNVCNGASIALSLSSTSAATYSWLTTDNVNTTGESTTAQTGSLINDVISNPGLTTQPLAYAVTPSSTIGCGIGAEQNVVVTSIPTPVMTSASVLTSCSSCPFAFPLTANVVSSFTWIAADNSNTVGESTTLQTTSTISQTITNYAAVSQPVTYTVTPTSTAGTCAGTPQIVTATITGDTVPVIISFTPLSGPIGTTVTITGRHFNPVTSNNVVFFGAEMAQVLYSSFDSMVVVVPAGASNGPISVSNIVTRLSGSSLQLFYVTFSCGGALSLGSLAPFTSAPEPDVPVSPYDIKLGDLDGDGKGDVIVTCGASSIVSIFRNTGSVGVVSFDPKVDLPTGLYSRGIALADYNGDGKMDIALCNNQSHTVSVFKNLSSPGTISFAPKIDFACGSTPFNVVAADFDGDGKYDLATSNYGTHNTSVLRNIGTGGSIAFAPKIDYAANTNPRWMATGDMNGDGKMDLVVANHIGILSIFRNTCTYGVISFAPKADFITSTNTRSVCVSDLDGDNKVDIATCHGISSLSVFRNIGIPGGGMAFTGVILAPLLGGHEQLTIDDLDGDAKPEILSTNAANTISAFRNNSSPGTIAFAPRLDFTVHEETLMPYVGDLDGDGKQDLLSTDWWWERFEIMLNQSGVPVMTSTDSISVCSGGGFNIDLTSTVPSTYNWVSNDNPNTVGENTVLQTTAALLDTITNITPGSQTVTYTVIPTSLSGCVGAAQTVTIVIDSAPVITISQTDVSCFGSCDGSATCSPVGTGPFTYVWSPGGQTTQTISTLCPGTYTVTATGPGGCSGTATVTIVQPPVLLLNGSAGNPTCPGVCDGTILSSASGGTAPYTYSGAMTGICAGTYTITVTDAHSCTATATVTLNDPLPLTATVSTTDVLCNDDCNGSASILVSGGDPPYSYLWCNGSTAPFVNGLCAGSCSVTIFDNKGCSIIMTVVINEPPVLLVSVPSSPDTICTGICEILQAIATGGTPGYSYQWFSPSFLSATNIANPICCPATSITYTVTAMDGNGCLATTVSFVFVPASPSVSYTQSPSMVCDNIASINLSAGSPVGGTYSGPTVIGNTFSPTTAGSGSYTITYSYMDAVGCSGSDTSNITVSVCSGIGESETSEEIMLYPNPTNDIVLVNGLKAGMEIRLFNALGKEVLFRTATNREEELSLKYLSSGIYFMLIQRSDGSVVKKIIKQ